MNENFVLKHEELLDCLHERDFLVQLEKGCNDAWGAKWRDEENLFRKFWEYKYGSFYGDMDCDMSLWAVNVYKTLHKNALDGHEIKKQSGKTHMFELIKPNAMTYRGDTLTSTVTVLKRYLGLLWKDDKIRFKNLFPDGIAATTGIPKVPDNYPGNWKEYFLDEENAQIIWEIIGQDAGAFFRANFKAGAFICIPGHSYETTNKNRKGYNIWESFNTGWAGEYYAEWDTADMKLLRIHRYFHPEEGKPGDIKQAFKSRELEGQSCCLADKLAIDFETWLKGFSTPTWTEFIESHCLQDFVECIEYSDENRVYGKPISLRTGAPIACGTGTAYDAMPSCLNECEMFFRTAGRLIEKRSKRIIDKAVQINK